MALDSKEQRRILGKFATGVTVASTKIGDETWGMTANAVTSLSLDPPLVILCIQKEGQSHGKFEQGGCFALNILSAEQQEISDRFAFKGPKDFSDLVTTSAETGAPILKDTLGWVDCRTERDSTWRPTTTSSSARLSLAVPQMKASRCSITAASMRKLAT